MIVIQLELLVAVQLHPPVELTVTLPVELTAGVDRLLEEREQVQEEPMVVETSYENPLSALEVL